MFVQPIRRLINFMEQYQNGMTGFERFIEIMEKETEKFYSNFCRMTQSKNGMWEQRFYTDGKLAPCWGYQIDETASVIYGVYSHYEYTKKEEFLKIKSKATRSFL